MARRDSSATGCGLIILGLFAFPVVASVIAVAAWVLAAPAAAAYLQVKEPIQFQQYRTQWLAVAGAAPVLALVLVWLASPRKGQLRGRPRRATDDPLPGTGRSLARRLVIAYLVRVAILLAATTTTTLVMLLRGNLVKLMNTGAHGPQATREVLTVFGSPAVAAAVVLLAIRVWDRRPYLEPVTVETVRAAAEQANQTLRQVRAENRRVSRLAREVEAKLAAARFETEFAALCNLHFESAGCANGAYGHYQSAQTSLYTMARILGRVQAASRRWLGSASRSRSSRARQDRAELDAAASNLAETRGQLSVEVQRGLDLVRTLNANTANLKHSIKDGCGDRGRLWYEALEQRIEAARTNDRRAAWSDR